MSKVIGRPKKYDFESLKRHTWTEIETDCILGCRNAARNWANKNNLKIITRGSDNKLLVYIL